MSLPPTAPDDAESINPPRVPGPALGTPTYTDPVRFRLALAVLAAVSTFTILVLIMVAAQVLTVADAKELALMAVAQFSIVSPVIGFYFASSLRG